MFASAIALIVLATLIVGLSFWGVLSPPNLVSFVRTFMHRPGSIAFAVAVAVRIFLATLLWLAAPASNTPTIFQVLAGVALVAALGIALAGSERVSKLIDHVASWPQLVIRLQCLLGVAFGLFLIWSVSPAWAAT